MRRSLRFESRSHQAATALLFGSAVIGCPYVVPWLLLIPAALCLQAGKEWTRGEPTSLVSMRRAHSTAIAFLAFVAVLAGLATMSGLSNEPEHHAGALVGLAVATGILLPNLLLSVKSLPGEVPHGTPSVSRHPPSTGVQAKPPAVPMPAADGDPVPPSLSGIDWQRFLSSTLYLSAATALALTAGYLLSLCVAGVRRPRAEVERLLPFSTVLAPVALFTAAVLVSSVRRVGAWVSLTVAGMLGGVAVLFVVCSLIDVMIWSDDLPPPVQRAVCTLTIAVSGLIALGAIMNLSRDA